jgi:uncharacterized membrane protein
MVKAENSITINKPVEDVFAYVNNLENSAVWQGGVESVKFQDASPGVGEQYIEVRKFLGRDMESTIEVTALELNKKYAAKTITGPVPFEVTVTFEPIEGGTRMTTTVEGEPRGFFKLAGGAVQKQLEKSLVDDGERLKGILS